MDRRHQTDVIDGIRWLRIERKKMLGKAYVQEWAITRLAKKKKKKSHSRASGK